MKRWITRILICLLLGAITTIAVVWGWSPDCGSLRFGFEPGTSNANTVRRLWTNPESNQEWLVVQRSTNAALCISIIKTDYFADIMPLSHDAESGPFPISLTLIDEVKKLENACGYADHIAAGWPMRAFHGTQGFSENATPPFAAVYERGIHFIDVPLVGTMECITTPIWTGIIVNTLVFTVFWLIFGPLVMYLMRITFIDVPRSLRQSRREQAGHCPNCDYDLQGISSNRCPECGAEIRWTRRALDSESQSD